VLSNVLIPLWPIFIHINETRPGSNDIDNDDIFYNHHMHMTATANGALL
jgi:beta-galactosidase beta subunit